jgi:hypothetical protein
LVRDFLLYKSSIHPTPQDACLLLPSFTIIQTPCGGTTLPLVHLATPSLATSDTHGASDTPTAHPPLRNTSILLDRDDPAAMSWWILDMVK